MISLADEGSNHSEAALTDRPGQHPFSEGDAGVADCISHMRMVALDVSSYSKASHRLHCVVLVG